MLDIIIDTQMLLNGALLSFLYYYYHLFIHSFIHSYIRSLIPRFHVSFLCCICHCTYCMNDLAVVVVGEIGSDCDRP